MLTRLAARALAVGLIAISYAFARTPAPTAADQASTIARFRFVPSTLPLVTPADNRSIAHVRSVHPSLQRIAGWISSVGAAVALADLDGNGLPDDVCHVEPRTDDVIVSSAGSERYAPFALPLTSIRYDADRMAPMGCLPADVDEDGRLDLIVYFWGRPPVAFLRREAASASLQVESFRGEEIVATQDAWYTNAATRADVDGDGHADLIIGNYFPDNAGVLDWDGAGRVSMQASMSRANNGGGLRLLRHVDRDDTHALWFEEMTTLRLPAEARHGWTLAVAATDLDNDLLPEIYMANDFGPDVLLHNESEPSGLHLQAVHGWRTPGMPTSHVLGRDSFKGMGIDVNDLDGDGRLDLFVSNIAAEYALMESHLAFLATPSPAPFRDGVAPFRDRSEALGLSRSEWAWDAKMDDFDNDGHVEVVQATGFLAGTTSRWPELQELATANDQVLADVRVWPRFADGDDLSGQSARPFFFARHADGRFHDIAPAIGLGDRAVSRGIAIADVDGDGRLDLAIANQWEPSTLWRNRSPTAGNFLGLHLRLGRAGTGFHVQAGHVPASADPSAWGVSARVTLANGRVLVRTTDGGNGHGGKRSSDLHVGLGDVDAARPVSLALAWRAWDGQVRRRTVSLTPGWYTVTLGE